MLSYLFRKEIMINYTKMVQDEVLNLKSTMTDKEFFSSDSYRYYMDQFIQGVLFGFKRGKQIKVLNYADMYDDFTAATNGYEVTNNILDPIVRTMETRAEKHYANAGKVCHEIWHILFSDFKVLNEYLNHLEEPEFTWSHKMESCNAAVVQSVINDDPIVKKLYKTVATAINNVLEDAYINRKGSLLMPGIPALGNRLYDNKMMELYGDYNDITKGDIITAFIQTFQALCFGYQPGNETSLDDAQKELLEIILSCYSSCLPYISKYLEENNGEKRKNIQEEISCCWFPIVQIFREKLKENKESGSDSGVVEGFDTNQGKEDSQGNGDGDSSENNKSSQENNRTESSSGHSQESKKNDISNKLMDQKCLPSENLSDVIDEIINEIKDNLEQTNIPKGNTKPESNIESGKENSSNTDMEMSEDTKNVFNTIQDQIMENIAKEVVEERHNTNLQTEGKEIIQKLEKENKNQSDTASEEEKRMYTLTNELLTSYHFHFYRPDPGSEFEYHSILDPMSNEITNTVRLLKKILKDKNRTRYMNGERLGRLDIKSVANHQFYQDGKIFKRKNEKDIRKIAFSILIDESGSMNGLKTKLARQISIELDAILSQLDIPLMITGHTCCFSDFSIDIFKDFDVVDGKDNLRLLNNGAYACNDDGFAIAYNCEKLLKREEQDKILIVISDGMPSGSRDSYKITKEMINKYRSKKISIYGAVIDGDFNNIQKLYGNQTIDCTNGKLTEELVGLVKRLVK